MVGSCDANLAAHLVERAALMLSYSYRCPGQHPQGCRLRPALRRKASGGPLDQPSLDYLSENEAVVRIALKKLTLSQYQ